mmetsp:Transcript_45047/g.97843  ORF Transcript_45047/g.97843 Transcript_45047/m.97843 type:complete len:202 (-) Transcript_45047:149-754(-)
MILHSLRQIHPIAHHHGPLDELPSTAVPLRPQQQKHQLADVNTSLWRPSEGHQLLVVLLGTRLHRSQPFFDLRGYGAELRVHMGDKRLRDIQGWNRREAVVAAHGLGVPRRAPLSDYRAVFPVALYQRLAALPEGPRVGQDDAGSWLLSDGCSSLEDSSHSRIVRDLNVKNTSNKTYRKRQYVQRHLLAFLPMQQGGDRNF